MPTKNSDTNNAKNNKPVKSKSEQNKSYTDLPDMKTNSSTKKTAIHNQD